MMAAVRLTASRAGTRGAVARTHASLAVATADTTGVKYQDGDAVHASVSNYYGKVLSSSTDLKTTACTTSGAPPQVIRDALKRVPTAITERYYGCGTPLPMGIAGLDVLDLGSGSGQDCYIAAALVGESGSVTGVDMTAEQLDVARASADGYCVGTLGYDRANMQFVNGYIELLAQAGVEPASKDLVISNCVINLSPDKERVIAGVYESLREGGEFYFSDVYCDRRLAPEVRNDEVLLGECLGGALYTEDFKRICQKVGFLDVRAMASSPIEVTDPSLKELCGEARFSSVTYRCFKLSNMETLCEDYGQVAYYKGTIPTHPHTYALDDHHVFETGRPMLVCGNTASMVGESWLQDHFTVVGDRSKHFGLFDCAPAPAARPAPEAAGAPDLSGLLGGSGGGGCC